MALLSRYLSKNTLFELVFSQMCLSFCLAVKKSLLQRELLFSSKEQYSPRKAKRASSNLRFLKFHRTPRLSFVLEKFLPLLLSCFVAFLPFAAFAATEDGAKLGTGEHLASLGEIELHYVVAGHGPLLFVTSPGWGPTSTYLQNTLTKLEVDHTMIFIDTRGSGKSSRPADPSHMSNAMMADDIEHLRQYLDVDAIDLMGHSNGGSIAISYAERYQPHLHKLVLIDSQLLGFNMGAFQQKFLKDHETDPRYRVAVVHARNDSGGTTDAEFSQYLTNILPLYFYNPGKYAEGFEQKFGNYVSVWAESTEPVADNLPEADETKTLGSIHTPTLILVGYYDWFCPPIVADKLHAGIPNSNVVVFKKTGHLPWIEEPKKFFPTVETFLKN